MTGPSKARWLLALGMVALMVLATTAATASVRGPAAYRVSSVDGVTYGEVPTFQAPMERLEVPWYESTTMDADHDGMFDMLDALVDAGSREPVDVLVDMDRTPTETDAMELASLVEAPGWALFPALR
ncbi:MAG: hypothetical protein GWN18_07630, partial [Thermoplasmata archaeon]|nr:hypothetical protein [Thermoplasmata archaeon]NIS11934.1 hypothetical protein [Thermoplasmata archaeon]NIS19836.1 hypothetical protein [Thermoplasmata archaeon]NIT77035.1 hypothetical protein [Thermoplasmata archaeon]NIU48945.1 hypothetical protein [Thermoplasmata archaeon]